MIVNFLEMRKREVKLVIIDNCVDIFMIIEELRSGYEIEEKIVRELVFLYLKFCLLDGY